jgi:hypothetical protein
MGGKAGILVVIVALAGCDTILAGDLDGAVGAPDASRDAVQPDVSSPDQTPRDASPAVDVSTTDLPASDTSSKGTVTGALRWWETYGPVADADICVYQNGKKTTQCTKTTQTGDFAIVVDANVELALLIEAPGSWKLAFPVKVEEPTQDIGTWQLSTDAEATAVFATAGVTYPMTGTGCVFITASSGAKVTVVPPAGVGPFYAKFVPGAVAFDKSMTEMGSGAVGGVFALLPGIYDVQVTHPTASCISEHGWPPTTTTLRGPVIAGYVTFLVARCL